MHQKESGVHPVALGRPDLGQPAAELSMSGRTLIISRWLNSEIADGITRLTTKWVWA